MTTLRRRTKSDSGVVILEYALVAPLLMTLLFGMVDMGRAFNYWIDQTHLANEAARYAAVNYAKPAQSGTTLQSWIREQAAPELENGSASVDQRLAICVDFPTGTQEVGDPVRVTATARFRWLAVIGIDALSSDLEGSATMRLESRPTNFAAGCSS